MLSVVGAAALLSRNTARKELGIRFEPIDSVARLLMLLVSSSSTISNEAGSGNCIDGTVLSDTTLMFSKGSCMLLPPGLAPGGVISVENVGDAGVGFMLGTRGTEILEVVESATEADREVEETALFEEAAELTELIEVEVFDLPVKACSFRLLVNFDLKAVETPDGCKGVKVDEFPAGKEEVWLLWLLLLWLMVVIA